MRWKAIINKRNLAGSNCGHPRWFCWLTAILWPLVLALFEPACGELWPPLRPQIMSIWSARITARYICQNILKSRWWETGRWGKIRKRQCANASCVPHICRKTHNNKVEYSHQTSCRTMPATITTAMMQTCGTNLSVPTVPPYFMHPPPPSTTAFLFVPSIPLTELVYGGWMSRPHGCCYMVGAHHRATYAAYLWRKYSLVQVLGKPPHEMTCPVRRNLQR
jgi:hypothetical protein